MPLVALIRRPFGCTSPPAAGSQVELAMDCTRATALVLPALGVDVEEDDPLDPDLVALVTTPAERRDAPNDLESWAKLMFSAKETVFKCWCTGGGARLADFAEFDVELTPDGEVRVRRQPAPLLAIRGGV